MTDLFVSYELAKTLKLIGFNEPCLGFYNNNTIQLWSGKLHIANVKNNQIKQNFFTAPLYQQVIDWFRETHNLVINVYANASGYCFELHDSAAKGGSHRYDSDYTGPNESGCWDNFYEAKQAAILYSLKII